MNQREIPRPPYNWDIQKGSHILVLNQLGRAKADQKKKLGRAK